MAPTQAQIIGKLKPAQAKDLLRRGFKVQARSKKLLSGESGHPKRVNTGALRSDIRVELRESGPEPVVRIGTNKKYARWVHDGTGIFGPRARRITPRSAKVLVFKSAKYGRRSGRGSGYVFVRSVKGMRRNQFLKDALPAARD